jgi:hypothetical protein
MWRAMSTTLVPIFGSCLRGERVLVVTSRTIMESWQLTCDRTLMSKTVQPSRKLADANAEQLAYLTSAQHCHHRSPRLWSRGIGNFLRSVLMCRTRQIMFTDLMCCFLQNLKRLLRSRLVGRRQRVDLGRHLPPPLQPRCSGDGW